METTRNSVCKIFASIMQVSCTICGTNKFFAGHSMCIVDKMELKICTAVPDEICNAGICIAK